MSRVDRIVELIEHALDDATSDDAVRWTPDPVDEATVDASLPTRFIHPDGHVTYYHDGSIGQMMMVIFDATQPRQ